MRSPKGGKAFERFGSESPTKGPPSYSLNRALMKANVQWARLYNSGRVFEFPTGSHKVSMPSVAGPVNGNTKE